MPTSDNQTPLTKEDKMSQSLATTSPDQSHDPPDIFQKRHKRILYFLTFTLFLISLLALAVPRQIHDILRSIPIGDGNPTLRWGFEFAGGVCARFNPLAYSNKKQQPSLAAKKENLVINESSYNLNNIAPIIKRRLQLYGYSDSTVRETSEKELEVCLPRTSVWQDIIDAVTQTGSLDVYIVKSDPFSKNRQKLELGDRLFTRDDIVSFSVPDTKSQRTQHCVEIQLKPAFAPKFAELTEQHVGDQTVVLLSGRINRFVRIGSAIQSGTFSVTHSALDEKCPTKEVRDWSILLSTLELPYQLSPTNVQTVAPALGSTDQRMIIFAFILGIFFFSISLLFLYGYFLGGPALFLSVSIVSLFYCTMVIIETEMTPASLNHRA